MSIQERLCSHAHSAEPECCSVNRTAESELGTFRMNNAAMNETAALWHGMRGKWRHARHPPLSVDLLRRTSEGVHLFL